jgi:hypothetical protein
VLATSHFDWAPLIAGAALIWSIIWSIILFRRDTNTRNAQKTTEAEVARLRQQQSSSLAEIALAAQRSVDPAYAEELGSRISFQLRSGTNHRTFLHIKNLGPGTAQVTAIEVPSDPKALTQTDLPLPMELLPDEEAFMQAFTHWGTRWPMTVTVTWLDGLPGEQTRHERGRALLPHPEH